MLSADPKINSCNDVLKLLNPVWTNQKYFQKQISSRELSYHWDDIINEFTVYPHRIERLYYINDSPHYILIARIYDYWSGKRVFDDDAAAAAVDFANFYVKLTVDNDGCSNGYIYVWKDLNNFLREVEWPEECKVILPCRLLVSDYDRVYGGGDDNDDDDNEEIFYCEEVD